jgi:hypothetical protein
MIVAAVGLVPLWAQSGGQTSAAPTIAQARARLQASDAEGARRILDQVVAATPKDGVAWHLLGNVRRQLKQFDAAIAALKTAHDLDPRNHQAAFDLGVAYAAAGKVDAAFEWLGRARASRQIDMTQLETVREVESLRADPRYASLLPTGADFANPFIEPVTIVREWPGEASNDQFGWIARDIGDVDGDGARDFATSAPTSSKAGARAGRIYVYSSKRGTRLWSADGAAGDGLGGGIESAGDINRDGVEDVVASAPYGGYAKVYSGRDGKELLTLRSKEPIEAFGMHIDGVGDVSGDGIPDLIVGAPGAPKVATTFTGRAYIFSGSDGSVLLTLTAERAGDRFGSAVAGAKHGAATMFAVGAPGAGPNRTGRTYVYRSLSQTPAFVIDAERTGAALGAMFLAFPGDLNRDGVGEVFASDWSDSAKGPSTGRIYVHSGKDGTRMYTLAGETPGEGFGTSASVAGDVDGDGAGDLIVGAWQHGGGATSGGRAYLYSGASGRLIRTFTCRTPGDAFGFDAVGLGDVDGDGTVDLLITSAWSGIRGFRSGRVFLVSSGVKVSR